MSAAIRRLQADLGLEADGIRGPVTTAAILEAADEGRLRAVARVPAPVTTPPAEGAPWDERSLRNLKGIHPALRSVMDLARQLSPVPFVVIEGLRSPERQAQLVAQGASRTRNSRHLTGHAVDICPTVDIDQDGRVETEEMFSTPMYRRLAPAVKAAADALGVAIVGGGAWRIIDMPHFELDRKSYP